MTMIALIRWGSIALDLLLALVILHAMAERRQHGLRLGAGPWLLAVIVAYVVALVIW